MEKHETCLSNSIYNDTRRERLIYQFRNTEPQIGNDTYVSEHALVIGDVRIGDNCYIGHGAILRGDYGSIEVGAGTAVEEGVIMHAPVNELCQVGKRVTIGHGAIIHSKSIGDDAVIGMGAVVSAFAEIGEGTIIGEGSTVTANQTIPAGVIAAGTPAKVLKPIPEANKLLWEQVKQVYIDLAKEYLRDGMPRVDS